MTASSIDRMHQLIAWILGGAMLLMVEAAWLIFLGWLIINWAAS